MLNLHRLAELLFPPVPRHLATEIAAHGCAQTPGPSSLGEVGGGSGQTPAAVAPRHLAAAGTPVVTQPVTGDDSESGAGTASPAPLSLHAPACETQVAFYPHPANRWDLSDERLGALIDRWKGATS